MLYIFYNTYGSSCDFKTRICQSPKQHVDESSTYLGHSLEDSLAGGSIFLELEDLKSQKNVFYILSNNFTHPSSYPTFHPPISSLFVPLFLLLMLYDHIFLKYTRLRIGEIARYRNFYSCVPVFTSTPGIRITPTFTRCTFSALIH